MNTEQKQPRAWMRRWAYEGIDVMALKPKDRPRGWRFLAVTLQKLFDSDVPLCVAGRHGGISAMNSATKPQFTDSNSAQIFTNVCIAMQDAEEIWGPSEEHYPELMDAIIAECEQRKTNCYLQHARNVGLTEVPPPNREK